MYLQNENLVSLIKENVIQTKESHERLLQLQVNKLKEIET